MRLIRSSSRRRQAARTTNASSARSTRTFRSGSDPPRWITSSPTSWRHIHWYHDPLRKAEERLFEIDEAHCERVFLAGANPFGLKTRRLLEIAGLVRKYFPACGSIGCFSRITDVATKTDEELRELAAAGYDGLTIGVETGDDDALAFMGKGYEAKDIVEQCMRLDDAGISYAFFYLVGISGKGRGIEGARRTADVMNRTNPRLIGANMLTIYKNSKLYQEILAGN